MSVTQKVKADNSHQPVLLQFPHPHPPAPGTVTEVAAGIYWLRMPLPIALDHINLWLLADTDGWVAVDCGFGSDATRQLWQAIFASSLLGKPISRVVVTHFHPDHLGLAGWLATHWQAPVLMSEPEYATAQDWHAGQAPCTRAAYMALFRSHGLSPENEAAPLPQENLFRRGVPEIPASIVPLQDDQLLHINGRQWRVMAGYGHSPQHMALACAELGVLIAGDMVLPRISTNVSVHPGAPNADPLGQFLDSLTRYARLDAGTLVLPAHGLPFHGLHQRVRQLHDHHAQRLDELQHACRVPCTAADLMPVLFKRALDTQQVFFAMGETLSHLNYLHVRAKLKRETGADGVHRYRRA